MTTADVALQSKEVSILKAETKLPSFRPDGVTMTSPVMDFLLLEGAIPLWWGFWTRKA